MLPPELDSQWLPRDLHDFLANPKAPAGLDHYTRLLDMIRTCVDLDHSGKATIIVCWILLTYLYPLFQAVPFIHVLGPKGTGKSQLIDTMAKLVRAGYESDLTAAVTGDIIEGQRVIPIIDQAHFLQHGLVNLLTASYRKEKKRTVSNKDERERPLVFEISGPKLLGGKEDLPEDLADRTIVIRTVPSKRRMPDLSRLTNEFAALRAASYRWAFLEFSRVEALYQAEESAWDRSLDYSGRSAELWRPIEVIMEALEVPALDRENARDWYQLSTSATKAELPDHHEHLLRVLLERLTDQETCSVRGSELRSALLLRGSDQSPKQIGKALRHLAVCRENVRIDTNKDRRYMIDGREVRSICRAYRIGPESLHEE